MESTAQGEIIRETKDAYINRCAGIPVISTRVKVTITCPMLFYNYPFDVQECPVIAYIPNFRSTGQNE